jgi:hypothetical protein
MRLPPARRRTTLPTAKRLGEFGRLGKRASKSVNGPSDALFPEQNRHCQSNGYRSERNYADGE